LGTGLGKIYSSRRFRIARTMSPGIAEGWLRYAKCTNPTI